MTFKRIFFSLIAVIMLAIVGGGAYVWLVLLDPARIKPFLTQQVQAATGRTLTIDGELTPAFSLNPSLGASGIRLSGAQWGKAETMLKAQKLEVSFSLPPLLSGQLHINSITLDGAEMWLEQKGKKANWQFSGAKDAPIEPAKQAANEASGQTKSSSSPSIDVDNIRITDSILHYRNIDEGSTHSLTIAQLDAQGIRAGQLEALTLDGRYRHADLTLKASTADQVAQIEARIDTKLSRAAIKGSLSLSDLVFDASVDLKSDNSGDLIALLEGGKGADLKPVALKSELGGTAQLIHISQLELTYGQSSVTGKGKLDVGGKIPSFTGALSMAQLDLRSKNKTEPAPASTQAATTSASSPAGASANIIPRTPLPFDALGAFNANASLKLGALLLDGGKFSDITAQLRLKNKKLLLSDIKASKDGGSLSATLSANGAATPPSVALALSTQKMSLGELMRRFANADSVTGGVITAQLDLKGAGQSLHHILASASGNYHMLIEKATYMPPEGVQEGARFFDLLRGDNDSGPVTIQCAATQFAINRGIAKSKLLALQSSKALVTGDGTINLGKETLNLQLKARSTALGFADVVPPLSITGSWTRPQVTLSAEKTLLNLGKIVLGTVSGAGLVAVVGEQFTDKLGITENNNPCVGLMNEAMQKAADADNDPKAAARNAQKQYLKTRDAISDNVKDALKDGKQDIKNLRDGFKDFKKLF